MRRTGAAAKEMFSNINIGGASMGDGGAPMMAGGGGGGSVRYSRLRDGGEGFSDIQYKEPPPKVPWRAIVLASTLFGLGTLLITVGALLLAGVIDARYSDRTWPLLILGTILFIPGFYHVRIAYYAYKGYHGYSFDDIPDFD